MLGPNKQSLVAGRARWQVRPGGRQGLVAGRASREAGMQARPGGRQGKRRSRITGKWRGRSRDW